MEGFEKIKTNLKAKSVKQGMPHDEWEEVTETGEKRLVSRPGEIKIRDLRKKDQYKIDDAYLNGYARLCGVYATAVYNSLSRHADFHTQECFPSIKLIAEQHSMDEKTVIKSIRKLEKYGIIKVIRSKDKITKRQLPNVYYLLDKSKWEKIG